ncbi:MAG: asparagine synthase (glutamine-hydrolyzing) [Actinobacteria bacterium]|uniref:Unannotated protein n=1 Tax=freshwater metagenome TaxID=449393 RepID=A0A6J6QEM0_9ZZZZ|nr:asparagine synthase (glutamine-hydrolyzing) [Actinomycetota bacterium]
MCGICGVVDLHAPADVETVRGMTATLAHRGPNGDGYFFADGVALGHRRLSVIDLTHGGDQPFHSPDGTLHLIYNGELYNYRELRHELEGLGHSFRSASDTEVLLTAYREWGDACVSRFNGMWAFAIWDDRRRRLFASRDRFGVKPFYYRWSGSRFSFASELKAFRADHLGGPLRPNHSIIRDYIAFDRFDHTDDTFFAGIRKLPAAHTLTLDDSGLRLSRYWSLERRDPPTGDPVAAVRELFLDSVRLRLRADVKVGTALSGGIDSSAVACTVDQLLRTEVADARPVGDRQATFTAYFDVPGYDERPYARAVVDRTIADPTWVTFTDHELVEALPSIVEAHDEPFRSTSICAGWFVMRAARAAGITVVLDGQGGDEVFAGYPAYLPARYRDLARRGRIFELARQATRFNRSRDLRATLKVLGRAFAPAKLENYLRAKQSGSPALVGDALRDLPASVEQVESPYSDSLRTLMTRILTVRGLPELLHAEDRNSMAHSIEARVPFLDYRLVELAFSLSAGELLDGVTTKKIVRRALADVLPPAVAARTDKLGFATPEAVWFRGALGDFAADVFSSQAFRERGFVNADAALSRLDAHRRGTLDAGFELWRALNVELWARSFLPATD